MPESYQTEPIPRSRRFSFDAGYLGRRSHIIHGLLEVDVTIPRARIRAHQKATGQKLSFTAFIIHCLAQAVKDNPHLHAYRDWRERLVIFEDVNVNAMFEVNMNGRKVPMPHIFKAVDKRSYIDLNNELRATQKQPLQTREASFMRRFLSLPAFMRHIFYRIVTRLPHTLRGYSSPIMVTAVGMFGRGSAWGLPMANFTTSLTLGTINKKPLVVDDQIKIREVLHLTVSINHDIVDGAPAARFVNQLRQTIESGYGLTMVGEGLAGLDQQE